MKKLNWLIILLVVFVFTANPAWATDSDATWLPSFGTAIVSGTKEINFPSSLIINCYSLQGEELGFWMQNFGTLPVPTDKVIMECTVTLVGLPNFQEIGLTSDWKSFYPAVWEAGKGYVIRIDTSKLPHGAKALNWYVKHGNNLSIVSFLGAQIKNAIKGEGYGISYIAITKAPALWDEMDAARKLRYLHGFYPMEAWCENPQEMQTWATEKMTLGNVLINATPGSVIEYHLGDNSQARQETVQAHTDGIALKDIPDGTKVFARILGQKAWTGEATVRARESTQLQWRYGGVQITSSGPANIELETNYLGRMECGTAELVSSRLQIGPIVIVRHSLTFDSVPVGLSLRVRKLEGQWSDPIVIKGGGMQTVNLDSLPTSRISNLKEETK